MSLWRWLRCLIGRGPCPVPEPEPEHDPRVHALRNSATQMRLEAEAIRRRRASHYVFGSTLDEYREHP